MTLFLYFILAGHGLSTLGLSVFFYRNPEELTAGGLIYFGYGNLCAAWAAMLLIVGA